MEDTVFNADATGTVNVITQITYLLFLFLVLAVFVERATEIFMSILKYADLKLGWYRFWNKQAEKFKDRLDRLYRIQGENTDDKKLLYKWILWNVVSDEPYKGGKAVVAAKSIRTQYYRIISRMFAFVLSLVFSIWVYHYLGVNLIDILENVGGYETSGNLDNLLWLKIFLTAGILTAGAEPLHQLIRRAERRGRIYKNRTS
ncbi:MAG: hypothetical protein ACQER7_15625 [Bacteroidota bacterium]